jgi:transcriptional regulator with XRE-family HTH domain
MSLSVTPIQSRLNFQFECNEWRLSRKFSQLDLALETNISQRHLSFLETGRSHPSRMMVMQLSEALDMPLRERNMLFKSAGITRRFTKKHL